MDYPILNELPTGRQTTDAFLGYNHNLSINEGEFFEMENLTSSYFPVLSPRKQRGTYPLKAGDRHPNGIISKDALCYVDGGTFYINDYPVQELILTDSPKQLVSMGAYVLIFPDKKYINTKLLSDNGNIEAIFESVGTTTFTLCKQDGEPYGTPVVSDNPPQASETGDYPMWIDTSSVPHSLKQYNKVNSMWVTIATTYIKISATGIGKAFKNGDGVTISGITVDALKDLNNTMIIQAIADDYIVVIGILDVATEQTGKVTVARKMPQMDFVIESGNRIWGCRYGVANNGQVVNEIYASKLGDFKNWNCFAGVTTDSYIASCGTDGEWTGAITYLGYPMFFKEECFHKVFGAFPSQFQIQSTTCRGVEKGSPNSMAIVNEVLLYKGRNGIVAYDGSLPQEVSGALGEVKYKNAVGGMYANKYYVDMETLDGQRSLFVYDIAKGLWHKEDTINASVMVNHDGELYYIDSKQNLIRSIGGTGDIDTEPIEWNCTTGAIGLAMPDQKYISRFVMRFKLANNSSIRISIQYDSIGDYKPVYEVEASTLRSYAITIRPNRCDHFRVRIEGTGEGKIFSITKTLEQGSDVS